MSNNDGYEGTVGLTSPHTKDELFQGITLSRVGFLVYIGLLRPSYLQLMLRVTEQMRSVLKKKFTLEEHLYFSYTHLVCRSALKHPGNNKKKIDRKILKKLFEKLATEQTSVIKSTQIIATFWGRTTARRSFQLSFGGITVLFCT